MTTRANDCADQPHLHVGLCQRAGYANGLADAAEPPESTLAAVLADHYLAGWSCGCMAWTFTPAKKHVGMTDVLREHRLHVAAAILAATPTAARIAQLEAELAAAEAKLAAVEVVVAAATPGLSGAPVDCKNTCWNGDCTCSGNFRVLSWDVDIDELRAALATQPAP